MTGPRLTRILLWMCVFLLAIPTLWVAAHGMWNLHLGQVH